MKHLLMDLDNTISESRQNASKEMMRALNLLIKKGYTITIVSGANLERARTQVPLKNATYLPQNGNHAMQGDKQLWINEFDQQSKNEINDHIQLLVNEIGVDFDEKKMVEDRGAQISFSFVGHNAPIEEKRKFDLNREIRTGLLERFPRYNAVIGGTTCIDYIVKTKGENIDNYIKLKNIKPSDCLYIGDALHGWGNDATVCGVIPTFEVKGPGDTLKFIKYLLD